MPHHSRRTRPCKRTAEREKKMPFGFRVRSQSAILGSGTGPELRPVIADRLAEPHPDPASLHSEALRSAPTGSPGRCPPVCRQRPAARAQDRRAASKTAAPTSGFQRHGGPHLDCPRTGTQERIAGGFPPRGNHPRLAGKMAREIPNQPLAVSAGDATIQLHDRGELIGRERSQADWERRRLRPAGCPPIALPRTPARSRASHTLACPAA